MVTERITSTVTTATATDSSPTCVGSLAASVDHSVGCMFGEPPFMKCNIEPSVSMIDETSQEQHEHNDDSAEIMDVDVNGENDENLEVELQDFVDVCRM